jgi:glutathione S-transferase
MLNLYGSPRTSSGRCFLLLEEAGVPYTTVPLDMMDRKEHRSPEFLRLNPNGKVPCLVDGDFVLWESLAINLYIADRYKPELLGQGPKDRALIEQWSLWALGELQPPFIDILIQTKFVPENRRDQAVIDRAYERIPALLTVLDKALTGRDYLLGNHLTLADLNMATVANIAINLSYDLSPYKPLHAWLLKMRERPAFKKYLALREAR